MRNRLFEAEVAHCRQLANEYKGRSEAKFLFSLAEAFDELERNAAHQPDTAQGGIRLFT
jgi:hypothetical protein